MEDAIETLEQRVGDLELRLFGLKGRQVGASRAASSFIAAPSSGAAVETTATAGGAERSGGLTTTPFSSSSTESAQQSSLILASRVRQVQSKINNILSRKEIRDYVTLAKKLSHLEGGDELEKLALALDAKLEILLAAEDEILEVASLAQEILGNKKFVEPFQDQAKIMQETSSAIFDLGNITERQAIEAQAIFGAVATCLDWYERTTTELSSIFLQMDSALRKLERKVDRA